MLPIAYSAVASRLPEVNAELDSLDERLQVQGHLGEPRLPNVSAAPRACEIVDTLGHEGSRMATRIRSGLWEVHGQTVRLPVRLDDATLAGAVYRVPHPLIDAELAPFGLRAANAAGTGIALVIVIDYRRFALGSYHEVALAVLAQRGRGAPRLFTLGLPVSEEFTREAGTAIWGLPKWLAKITCDVGGKVSVASLTADGRSVMTADIRTRTFGLPLPIPMRVPVLSRAATGPFAGQLLRGSFSITARGLRLGRGPAQITWGDHPMADQARRLGLDSRTPTATFSASRLSGSLPEPAPVPD